MSAEHHLELHRLIEGLRAWQARILKAVDRATVGQIDRAELLEAAADDAIQVLGERLRRAGVTGEAFDWDALATLRKESAR